MKWNMHIDGPRPPQLAPRSLHIISSAFLIALLCLLPCLTFSQINLKVKPRTAAEAFLRWNEGPVAPENRLQMPGMEAFANFDKVQALSKSAALSQLYTIQFP